MSIKPSLLISTVDIARPYPRELEKIPALLVTSTNSKVPSFSKFSYNLSPDFSSLIFLLSDLP